MATSPDKDTWRRIIRRAYALFEDLEEKGFGTPPFSLDSGTVLMLDYKHRLSKDIDFFAYDAQWLGLLSPRFNEKAAALAVSYDEQSDGVKMKKAEGDIEFIVAGDVTRHKKARPELEGRGIDVDPPSEILAKRLFFRAASFLPRDVYDMSAAIDIAPDAAREAARAAASKKDVLMLRLDELAGFGEADLLRGIAPYDGVLRHGSGMMSKVRAFVARTIGDLDSSGGEDHGDPEARPRRAWPVKDGRRLAVNAVTNASREPVGEEQVLAILRTGDGEGHLVRALFGDCGVETLARAGMSTGMSLAEVRNSYCRARERHGARNPELEEE